MMRIQQRFIASCCFILFSVTNAYAETEVHQWKGQNYHLNSSSQKDAAKDLLSTVTLLSTDKVLDIGCGDGKISAALAAKLPQGKVLGVDISQSMIRFAKQAYEEKYPNLNFILGDFHSLPTQEKFDVVLSFTTLQWAKDHRKVLREVSRVLKPNGTFAVTMPMGLPKALKQVTEEIIKEKKWKHYFTHFSTGWNFSNPKQYKQLLEEELFSVLSLKQVPQHDIFPSKEAFTGFISQWFPYLRPIPMNDKSTFMNEVLERFLEKEPLDSQGRVHFKIYRLEAQSQKTAALHHKFSLFTHPFSC